MLKSVTFDEFSSQCPYFYTFGDGYINGGYNCKHPDQREAEDVWYKEKKEMWVLLLLFMSFGYRSRTAGFDR